MAERQQTTDKKKRPLPPFCRKAEHIKDINVYALLIGINDYQGTITPLGGCVKDVRLIKRYLKARFPEEKLHVQTLLDEEATRENIIQAFQDHLINGGGRGIDTFWFHFSGHGAEQFTAEAFFKPKDKDGQDLPSLEPNGKDQTLVCYNPEGTQDDIFLADKELAALLNQLFTQIPALDELKPHIVVSLDCCHSGTGTRDFLEADGMRTRHHRFIPPGTDRDTGIEMGLSRSIDQYIGGYKEMQEAGSLVIPQAPHLLISACAKNEKAGDLGTGGVFTANFVDLLDDLLEPAQVINYAQLFSQTRSKVLQERDDQTPQFEPVGGFNPYTSFLEGWEFGDSNQFEVFKQDEDWYIRNGAIHGLPVRSEGEIKVQVYSANPVDYLGLATVSKVNMQDSKVTFDDFEISELAEDDGYFAELYALPAAPEHILVQGNNEDAILALIDNWNIQIDDIENDPVFEHLNVFPIRKMEAGISPAAEIYVDTDGTYQINDIEANRLLDAFTPNADLELKTVLRLVKRGIDKIVRWKRLRALANPTSKLVDAFEFELLTMDYARWKEEGEPNIFEEQATFISKMEVHTSKAINLFGSKESLITPDNGSDMDLEVEKDTLIYGLRLKSKQPDLFYYVYNFRQNRAIDLVHDLSLSNPTGEEGTMLGGLGTLDLLDEENEDTFHLKLLVTRKPIEKESLVQTGFPIDRGGLGGLVRASDANDWYFQDMTIKLIRQHNPGQAGEPLGLSNGGMTILPQDQISADISLVSPSGQASDPATQLGAFAKVNGLTVVPFTGNDDNLGEQNILHLNNIQITEGANLAENPLVVTLHGSLMSDELVVPIAFDGQYFRVIGDSHTREDGPTQVNIRKLPEVVVDRTADGNMVVSPFNDEPVDPSLFEGLKIGFFKLPVVKKTELGLRWIHLHRQAGIKKHTKRKVRAKIDEAENILLVLPGLFGNSADIAQNLPQMKDTNRLRLHRKYDLVLTYDYDPFKGSLKAVAKKLKRALGNVGVDAEEGRKVTILAHSIGGLIARWLIEEEEGHEFVDQLTMVGTSNLGMQIDNWSDYSSKMVDLIANYHPQQLPAAIQSRQRFLNNQNDVKVTGDLAADSRFLKQLNAAPDVGVPYAIIGANVKAFDPGDASFAAFLSRFGLDEETSPHDLTATLESINGLGVWSSKMKTVDIQEVIGYHFNYFLNEEGRLAVGKKN